MGEAGRASPLVFAPTFTALFGGSAADADPLRRLINRAVGTRIASVDEALALMPPALGALGDGLAGALAAVRDAACGGAAPLFFGGGEPGGGAAYGEVLDWNALCQRAVLDEVGGGFVMQQVIDIHPESHLVCNGPAQIPTELYVDFSAYSSVGLANQPAWGGVCRGSLSHIVNIVGGGGVLPLLTTDVARSLLMAHRAWGQ
jgi:hypothetical protein